MDLRASLGGRIAALRAVLIFLLLTPTSIRAQSTATLQGRVLDTSDASVPGASISVRNASTGFHRAVRTDSDGRYQVAPMPAGSYEITATATGFKSVVIQELYFDVGRTLVRDFRLEVGNQAETIIVTADSPLIDRVSTTVGQVVTGQAVHEIPLNGQHFIDLALLVPGSVAPSQTAFSAAPLRGIGALAVNTTGNREEAVAFVVNGVSSNNLTFGSLMYEPSIPSIHEFRIDNSAFSAEFGHVSGAIVNIVTQSGSDEFHGEAFEFLRNDAFDARNFFEYTSSGPHPFNRNQFGGSAGGPLIRGRTFFFTTYDGLRQRQGLDINSLVLSDQQRAAAADPAVQRLIALVPRANVVDADGTSRFVGSADASVSADRWTIDVRHNIGQGSRLHGYYGIQRSTSIEPTALGNTIPGFGSISRPLRSLVTAEVTQTLGPSLVNEARFGRSGLSGDVVPASQLNPADFGIRDGVSRPIGLPQMIVAGGLDFGGPAFFPQGRNDASYVFVDTMSKLRGMHSMRFGGEYRDFLNENFAEGTGLFNFPTVASFLAGTANAFSVTLGERRNHIRQRATGLFFGDSLRTGPYVTVELGLRYEWHVTPTEQDNQFVVFDAATASLLQVGVDVPRIYQQNNLNFEPRAGVAWDMSHAGRTVLRAAYGRAVDEPGTTAVRDTASNPPFATPLAAVGSIPLATAVAMTRPDGLAPATIDPEFKNASLQSWNVNLQQQLSGSLAGTIGYYGSRGTNLRISRNLNQPINGVRPFVALSPSSPILPNTPLGNIMQVESTGFSRYAALWLSLSKRLSAGLQFEGSYTWSTSRDTNSLNSSGFAVQNSYDIPGQYGLSDFDARHRFVLSALYQLPFTSHAMTRGWQVAVVTQFQSGNPVNIVTSNSTLNGEANTVRPDVTGPIRIIGSVDQWFDTSVFVAADHFGNLGRNVVIGPGFANTDVSIIKTVKPAGQVGLQLRVDAFNVFNHTNFGPPGNVVGSPSFGEITRTRLPTGEAGSSRQIQFGMKMSF
jgi:hypothetical protein